MKIKLLKWTTKITFGWSVFSLIGISQNVGIGTITPDPSAKLHIVSSTQGVLIPSVGITSISNASPVVNPAVGLLIFNDGSGNVSPIGFYWWNGYEWRNLIDSVVTKNPLIGDGTIGNPVSLQGGNNAGDVLIWDGSQWQIKPSPFDSVCGTAMANYVMKWTGSELCNSIIYDDGIRVGIGTNSPRGVLEIQGPDTLTRIYLQDSFVAVPMITMKRSSRDMVIIKAYTASTVTAGHIPRLEMFRADGTISSPLPTRGDQWLGAITVGGYDTAWTGAGVGGGCESGIIFAADGDWTPSSHPTDIAFKTIDSGSTCGKVRMYIDRSGKIGIGTIFPQGLLHVKKKTGSEGELIVRLEADGDGTDDNANPQLQFVQDGGQVIVFFHFLDDSIYGGNGNKFAVGYANLFANYVDSLLLVFDGPRSRIGIGIDSPLNKLHVNGDIRIGPVSPPGTGTLPGAGNRIIFSGGPAGQVWNSDNSDIITMFRYNVGHDSTELRIKIGDNYNGNGWDALVIGAGQTPSPFEPFMIVNVSNRRVGIGTYTPTNILTVQQGSPTDPIADSWTVYSTRETKAEVIRVVNQEDMSKYLKYFREMPVYKWRRTEGEQVRLSPMADDAGVPGEIRAYGAEGKVQGIDLYGYIGFLHTVILALDEQYNREITLLKQRISELERQLQEALTDEVNEN